MYIYFTVIAVVGIKIVIIHRLSCNNTVNIFVLIFSTEVPQNVFLLYKKKTIVTDVLCIEIISMIWKVRFVTCGSEENV